ncbi:MAG TPA: galactokinase [Polyangiaceae bacterium]
MIDPKVLKSEFVRRFSAPPRLFSAPGRVNLIGEHTDYNDGFVLPMAIERRTVVAASPRDDRRIVAFSVGLADTFELDLDRPGARRRGIWGDFVEGTARALLARGVAVNGANLVIDSDVPRGAGLSASAALETSVGLALASLASPAELDRVTLAKAGQAAEHEYVGTLCGIMDQYIAALGVARHALLVDCRSLEARRVPLDLRGKKLVVCDTTVKHDLASSAYNERRAECEEAVRLLRSVLPDIAALRDVDVATFERHASLLPATVRRRARHVVTENARTLRAVEALTSGDFEEFGRLMHASHVSLRDDYEVSCPELDLAVDEALALPGVFGARMTGGGFGGCAIALVANEAAGALIERVSKALAERFGLSAHAFATDAADGAREE